MDTLTKPPVERIFCAFSLVMTLGWMRAGVDPALSLSMCALHLALAGILLILPPAKKGPWPVLAGRQFLPFGLWALAWAEIGWLRRLEPFTAQDLQVQAWDRALFGLLPHDHLARWLPWSWLNEAMDLTYLSYYLLILGPVALLAWRRRERLAEHTQLLMGTYLLCFTVYLFWPVLGPREWAAAGGALAGDPAPGLGARMMEALFRAGDAKGTAFPSSHCAASLAAALATWRSWGPVAGRLCLAWALLIALATVYTGNHYAIDALAGLALALAVWVLHESLAHAAGWAASLERGLLGSAAVTVTAQMGTSSKEETP
jgi:membrane-associated phospholipid phosphatase